MAYVDINTPVVEEIVLPSGNTYYVADREIRDVVQTLSETIAGGVSYIVAWDGASTPVVANIPAGVKVTYNGTTYTGTLAANSAQAGAFYLVKSSTTPSGETLDVYDEYVPVGSAGSKKWEKIGDTKIDLSDVVTGVTLNKQTDTVIGSDATFTVTQPSVSVVGNAGTTGFGVVTGVGGSLVPDTVSAVTGLGSPTTKNAIGASSTFTVTQPSVTLAGTTSPNPPAGSVSVLSSVGKTTSKLSATATGGAVSASGDNVTALTGVKVTAQPTVTLTENTATATGRIQYMKSPSTATSKKLSAAATGGAVSASGDSVTVITGISFDSDTIYGCDNVSTEKLVTTSLYGVGSSTTTASKATAAASQTTATGSTAASTVNTDLLKGISVSNGVLTFGAATLNTQTTTQQTFSDVTVPIKNGSATTVATGSVTSSGSGASVVTGVSRSAYEFLVAESEQGVPGWTTTTDTVLGTASTFNVTQPTITLTSGSTGDVSVVTALTAGQTRYLSASASGTAVGADGTDTVLGTGSTFSVTNPTVTIASGTTGDVDVVTNVTPTAGHIYATASGGNVAWNSKDTVAAVTGYASPTTANVLGEDTDIEFSVTTDKIAGRATGGNVAWNNKDTVTVLKNTTDVNVTKGS